MIKQILWQRSGGYYLFWTSFVYFWTGMYVIFVDKDLISTSALQIIWIAVLAFPFTHPPFGRWLNMDITWDKNMFNWFGNKDKENDSKVIKFPEPKSAPSMPKVEPPKQEEPPAKIYYRLGLTDNNRVAFSMGYSEITMNAQGVQNMIDQLAFFKTQLQDETDVEEEGDSNDAGTPKN